MLLVHTMIAPSKINGIGLFADQFIPRGTLIWRYTEGFDIKVDKAELEKLSEPAKKQFLKYSYFSRRSDKYVLCFDDARFYNHSESPNVLDTDGDQGDEGIDVAARDIYPGEELTCNYRAFDVECANMKDMFREGESMSSDSMTI